MRATEGPLCFFLCPIPNVLFINSLLSSLSILKQTSRRRDKQTERARWGKSAKTSRKGEKAWRANISTEDIEDFFEKSTKDVLSGGNLSAAPSEDLFRVDKSHDLPVKRKIEKHREKVLRYDTVLKKNPFVQVVSSSKPKSKISKKPIVIESKTPKQAQKNVDDDSVMVDLWGDDNKGERESNSRKIKMTSTIPAVEVDPAGCSYNPTAESHEDMLAEAVAQEMQKVYKNELGPEPVPLTVIGDSNIEDEAGLLSVCNRIINGKSAYFLGVDNGSEGEEETDVENEVSEAGNKTARTTKSKMPSDLIKVDPVRSKLRVESSNPVVNGNPLPRPSKAKLLTPDEAMRLGQVAVPAVSEPPRPKIARATSDSPGPDPARATSETPRSVPALQTPQAPRPVLKPVRGDNDESIQVAWGQFKSGETNRSVFSGQMLHSLSNSVVSIYPKKGEIWAMFSGLDEEYDFVEIVNDFTEEDGIGVAYLGKIEGFASLFHREAKNQVCQKMFAPEQMFRFLHKVPAIKMTGIEKECVPADSYKLDLTALPKDIVQADAVSMKIDSETMKRKADAPGRSDHLFEREIFEISDDDEIVSLSLGSSDEEEVDSEIGEVTDSLGSHIAFDFKSQRSEDKFQVDQIWAIYSKDKGMPTEYVEIKEILTEPEFVLHVTHMEPATEPVTRPVSYGYFKSGTGKPEPLHRTSFSHLVTHFRKKFVKIYPLEGEIWALRKNCDSTKEEYHIVHVEKSYCDGKTVVNALTGYGFGPRYIKRLSSLEIPKAEMSRFSHRIPAVNHKNEKKATRQGGQWELDPAAIPGRTIVID